MVEVDVNRAKARLLQLHQVSALPLPLPLSLSLSRFPTSLFYNALTVTQ
jgi:hypothetical protein